jgi:hypothetical protein
LTFLNQRQIITEWTQAGLELLMIQELRFVLVEMPEDDEEMNTFILVPQRKNAVELYRNLPEVSGEFLESLLWHTSHLACLYLLFKIVSHSHSQLIQLIPLLRQTNSRMFCIPSSSSSRICLIPRQSHFQTTLLWESSLTD